MQAGPSTRALTSSLASETISDPSSTVVGTSTPTPVPAAAAAAAAEETATKKGEGGEGRVEHPSTLSKTLSRLSHLSRRHTKDGRLPVHKRDFGFLPIPKYCRFDPNLAPEDQPVFTLRTNLVFALASTVSVMNIYFAQPMLVEIANDLGVSHEAVSRIPTLAQAGYGVGILFLSPLGDMLRRRQILLCNFFLGAGLTIGLALARNIAMLEGLSFLVSTVSITPQLCIPWTADLAPANVRARAMSITISGLITGLVSGRVFSGILATYTSWRDAYWFGVALQATMLFVLWLNLPDSPDKGIKVSYPRFLWSMFTYLHKYPTLLQASLAFCLSSGVFSGFWTTMTFVLSDPPYHYSPFDIGLFGLLGIIGALLAPQWGRLIDRIVPWTGQMIGFLIATAAMIIALGGANKNLSCVCIPMVLYDVGSQLAQVASTYRIQGLEPNARARMNGCFLLLMFIGQVSPHSHLRDPPSQADADFRTSGTAIMTKVYNSRGWTLTGVTAVVAMVGSLFILLIRGPHETGWIGWGGGAQLIRRDRLTDLSPTAITEHGKGHRAKKVSKLEEGDAENGIVGNEDSQLAGTEVVEEKGVVGSERIMLEGEGETTGMVEAPQTTRNMQVALARGHAAETD